jgi:hypothetical protein
LRSHRILHRRIALLKRFYNKVYNHKSISDEVIEVKIMDIKVDREQKLIKTKNGSMEEQNTDKHIIHEKLNTLRGGLEETCFLYNYNVT